MKKLRFSSSPSYRVDIMKGHWMLLAREVREVSDTSCCHCCINLLIKTLIGIVWRVSDKNKHTGKWKVRMPSHASMSKYHANKNYENLWFILLQVTKGFRFQKNKNVCFISGNFSSERFSWKVKTIRYGLYILINKHLKYRCLEFTILKCTWRIFAKKIINFSLEFSGSKPFIYVPRKWLWSKI